MSAIANPAVHSQQNLPSASVQVPVFARVWLAIFWIIIVTGAFTVLPFPVRLMTIGIAVALCLYSTTVALSLFLGAICVTIQSLGMKGFLPGLFILILLRAVVLRETKITMGAREFGALGLLILAVGLEGIRASTIAVFIEGIYPAMAIFGAYLLAQIFRDIDWKFIRVTFLILTMIGIALRLINQFVFPAAGLSMLFQQDAANLLYLNLEGDKTIMLMTGTFVRMLLPGEEPNYASMQLTLQAAILLLLLAQRTRSRTSLAELTVWTVVFGLSLLEILGTYSRTGYLCCTLLSIAFTFILVGNSRNKGAALVKVALTWGAIVVFGFNFMLSTFGGMSARIQTMFEQLNGGLSARTIAWEAAWTVFKENPILGGGTYSVGINMGIVAHNSYMNAFAEQGLVVGIPIFALVAAVPLLELLRNFDRSVAPKVILVWSAFSLLLLQMNLTVLNAMDSWAFMMWLMVQLSIAQWFSYSYLPQRKATGAVQPVWQRDRVVGWTGR